MSESDLARIALAPAVGLLIGIQRGWQELEERDSAQVQASLEKTSCGAGGWCGRRCGYCFLT
jgi:hypothetical protein